MNKFHLFCIICVSGKFCLHDIFFSYQIYFYFLILIDSFNGTLNNFFPLR